MKARTWGYGAVGVVVALGLWWWTEVRDANQRYAAEKAEEARVVMSGDMTDQGCPSDFPLHVRVTNGSQKTLKKIDYELSAYEAGSSADVATGKFREWTTILGPGERGDICLPRPSPSGRRPLSIQLTPKFVGFYLPGEFIPPRASATAAP